MHQPTRTDILNVLTAHNHPMQRFDLALRALWTTGYDEQTHRHIRDINTSDVSATTRLIDTMRAEGTLVLNTANTWRTLLGKKFSTDSLHHRSGYYWYATPEQHPLWGGEQEETRARIDGIRARLDAAALPTLFTDTCTWDVAGNEVDGSSPKAVRTHHSIVTAEGLVVAEVDCNHDPEECMDQAQADKDRRLGAAAAALITEAASDLAFLLSLVDGPTQAGAK
ncbi:hypothetical protein OG897_35430 [Streptomyces sp. NBC_00237]|uniref:hypothetical protein n=1 Tax=Streptomyces sp. NBC_00237 TaxID=2975687 RepID=UPI002252A252|nr:hypothetical protein [Streptomyces sp. NBC_00237]MCX5206683.1 hypothetical protein [Streptomyces sp. NBC_00237]